MKLYIGVNSDKTEIISKQPLKRFFDEKTNERDIFSYNDMKRPPHWMLDYAGIKIHKYDVPIDRYLNLPEGSIRKIFGVDLSWENDCVEIEL